MVGAPDVAVVLLSNKALSLCCPGGIGAVLGGIVAAMRDGDTNGTENGFEYVRLFMLGVRPDL